MTSSPFPTQARPGSIPRFSLDLEGGYVSLVDLHGTSVGAVSLTDPLECDDPEAMGRRVAERSPTDRLIILSGSLDPASEQHAWMPRMKARFEAFAAGVEETLEGRGGKPVIWPHALGAISDAPSLQTFLRTRQDRGWSFVFDPAWLMTADMQPLAYDHFLRFFDLLGSHPAAAIFVEDEATRHAWPAGWNEPESVGGGPWNRLPRLVRSSISTGR
jgi:hypothetical protein